MGAEYYALTPCVPWSPPFPVEFTFSAGGQNVRLPARSDVQCRRDAPRVRSRSGRGKDLRAGSLRARNAGAAGCLATGGPLGDAPRTAAVRTGQASPSRRSIRPTRRCCSACDVVGGGRNSNWANLVKDPAAFDESALRDLSQESRQTLLP